MMELYLDDIRRPIKKNGQKVLKSDGLLETERNEWTRKKGRMGENNID